MREQTTKAVVLGAGPGGYVCAIRLGQLGVPTVCIDRGTWGGVCLNVGCIPSKAIIEASRRFAGLGELAKMGIVVEGGARVDVARLQAWKQSVVDRLTGGVRMLLDKNGVTRLEGEARIEDAHTLLVETADGPVRVRTEHLVLATGSRPVVIPGFEPDGERILDSTGALALDEVPGHLLVVGGGYIGLELGQAWARLGSRLTVVEATGSLMPGFDPDVVKLVARRLKKMKAKVLTDSRALGWEPAEGGGVRVRVATPKGEQVIEADRVLVTVGRRPNLEPLEPLGLAVEDGRVRVDERQRTSVPGVYAIGDIAPGPMLAHKASYEGEVAAEAIAGHAGAANDARAVPAIVFTDPEIAAVGLMEHEARARGIDVRVGRFPWAANGRALTTLETDGFVKVVSDAADGRVLGVTIVGPHASDLISEAALAIEMGAEALDVALTMHPHPTLGEAVMEAAKAALGQAIHVLNG